MVRRMALTSVYLAEEALSLPLEERAALARLLLDSVTTDGRSDAEIRADLQGRLARLKSGEDKGLSFEAVFGEPA
jgi:putative addiction module component (TIGR02574 family)